ncbi:MAG TPA: magnesium transporter [Clostridiales bacterium]|nr:magnesium transporter [Clostridiales bacterium]
MDNKDEIKKEIENNPDDINDIQLVDLAVSLSDYEDEELEKLCLDLNDENLAKVLEEAETKIQKKLIGFLDNSRVIDIFSFMSKDDIADVLGVLNTGRRKQLINIMKTGDKAVIKELLGYKDDSAGGIMTTEYIALYQDLTVKEAIKKIKEIASKTEYIQTIYVMNPSKKIMGTVDLRDIIVAKESLKLEEIAEENFIYVEPELDQEEVAKIVSKYDLNAVPVLNSRKRMLGIIMVDDIVDVLVEEQTEDILKMGGVAKEETLDSTLIESIRMRLPWLLINLLTAFLAALTVKCFESTIAKVVALSATMSIVTGMGGNAGTQTVSIIIRNLAMGKVKFKEVGHLILKEVILGLINGAIIGLVTGIIVALIYHNVYLGLIIFLAMIGNLIISGFFGLVIPIVLEKLKVDPALSSSIFLTTATDVLGFFLFLSLASIFLSKLV